MSSDIDVMTLRFTMKGYLRDNASIDNIFIDALIRCYVHKHIQTKTV